MITSKQVLRSKESPSSGCADHIIQEGTPRLPKVFNQMAHRMDRNFSCRSMNRSVKSLPFDRLSQSLDIIVSTATPSNFMGF